jgi:hypothetical protein
MKRTISALYNKDQGQPYQPYDLMAFQDIAGPSTDGITEELENSEELDTLITQVRLDDIQYESIFRPLQPVEFHYVLSTTRTFASSFIN